MQTFASNLQVAACLQSVDYAQLASPLHWNSRVDPQLFLLSYRPRNPEEVFRSHRKQVALRAWPWLHHGSAAANLGISHQGEPRSKSFPLCRLPALLLQVRICAISLLGLPNAHDFAISCPLKCKTNLPSEPNFSAGWLYNHCRDQLQIRFGFCHGHLHFDQLYHFAIRLWYRTRCINFCGDLIVDPFSSNASRRFLLHFLSYKQSLWRTLRVELAI